MPGLLPIAILLPHAGLEVPSEVTGRLALSEPDIFNEADVYTEQLYDFRNDVAVWLRFPYARAIIDVNRSQGGAHSHDGDGIVKTQTSYGAAVYHPGAEPNRDLERMLVERYWRPWHQHLAAIAANPAIRLVIDCHTMAAAGPGQYSDRGVARPRVCVANLGDRWGRSVQGKRPPTIEPELAVDFAAGLGARLAGVAALAPTGADAKVNAPFGGGWNIQAHSGRPLTHGGTSGGRQAWLMVEVSRALYVGAQSGTAPVRPADHQRIGLLRDHIWASVLELLAAVHRSGSHSLS